MNRLIKFDISSQISGGQSQHVFYIIFLVLNRVYGEEATGCAGCVITEDWSRGKVGGWMRQVCGSGQTTGRRMSISEAPSMAGFSSIALSREFALSQDAIKLLNLFSADSAADRSILRAMNKLHQCDDTSLSIFPSKIQWKYNMRPEYECIETFNHVLYDDWFVGSLVFPQDTRVPILITTPLIPQ